MNDETVGNKINYCVLIPTYNNAKTLENVISSALEYAEHLIVVNDGSNDETQAILERLRDRIEIVSYEKNRGKGAALRIGLMRAEKLGFEYAVTLDSDGQHFPSEIPKLLQCVVPGRAVMVIGSRDMSDANVPQKSLFGRKFSNFWVRLETGHTIDDTQSGFRLYTVSAINRFHFFTVRYDFEIESLVRWLWKGYPVETVTVQVYYPPAEERVSHFKGFRDNFRISVLNTVLVTLLVVLVIPGGLFRAGANMVKRAFFRDQTRQ